MDDTELISIEAAEALLRSAFRAVGVSGEAAASVAKALVAAEAEGQVGHGFSRVNDYVAQARSGKIDGAARPTLSVSGAASAVVDAGNGFAYPALDLAAEWAVETATTVGCASVGVTRSHHCGALSVQVDRLARRGVLAIMMANAPAAMSPWGAKEAVFGTNPIAFAAPRRDGAPLVIDLSLSRVARGKVMHARKTGSDIPIGWAFDADGAPTTDPEAALAGTMAPIGEAKGTSLALMVEILAAVWSGANASRDVSSFFTADGPPPGSGQFILALSPPDLDAFIDRVEPLLETIAALEGARLPGARREESLARARAEGVRAPRAYLDAARAIAAEAA